MNRFKLLTTAILCAILRKLTPKQEPGAILLWDLRQVTLVFVDGSTTSHIVHKNDVERLVSASIKLHGYPGLNPHNGNKTAKARQIYVEQALRVTGPHWWSTPNLRDNYDRSGASVYHWSVKTTVYRDDLAPLKMSAS